ncbi:MAG TPA: HNH endonuclease signature motif containing protein [Ktedonobacteraceae bacterium]|nr:HNH endonuclease signature motif containing protein [Ktedonobacteraceae bacterium]
MSTPTTGNRRPLSMVLKREVLTEAGYRCAVPTCRNILALDLHHINPVEEGGPNTLSNLLALCLTCHALYTRGIISREAIHAWKQLVMALSYAFNTEAISLLLFLKRVEMNGVLLSGDGMLRFASLFPLISVTRGEVQLALHGIGIFLSQFLLAQHQNLQEQSLSLLIFLLPAQKDRAMGQIDEHGCLLGIGLRRRHHGLHSG